MTFEEVDGDLWLWGRYVLRAELGAPERIPVAVLFTSDYPRTAPIPYLLGDRFVRDLDHHLGPGPLSFMCLWLPAASPWDPRDPDGLQTFLDQMTLFLHRQLIMEADPSLPYPGPEWPHGFEAYLLFLESDLGLSRNQLVRFADALEGHQRPRGACPCGSGSKFRRCHQPGIDRFRFRLPRDHWAPFAAFLREAS